MSAALFAFLLSWGNFPLSLFTTGADSTLPQWLYARMVSGYSPLVPTVGMLSVAASMLLLLAAAIVIAIRAMISAPASLLRSKERVPDVLSSKRSEE